jgi:hypothetical protein
LILRKVPIFKIEMGTFLKINLVPSGRVAGLTEETLLRRPDSVEVRNGKDDAQLRGCAVPAP